MGLHWIYDMDKITSLLTEHGRSAEPAFFEPPSCPYYEYESGAQSPYGDELLPVLQYMTTGPGGEHGGTMDGEGFAKFLAQYYAAYKGRLNKSSRAMMEAVLQAGRGWPECGDPRDTQANNFVKVVPLVARYAGRPGLAAAVDAAVRSQQNSDEAVELAMAAALILERVVLGHTVLSAVQWAAAGAPGSGQTLGRSVLGAVADVLTQHTAGTPLRELLYAPGSASRAGRWGPSCANPGALQGALLGALQTWDAARLNGTAAGAALGAGADAAEAGARAEAADGAGPGAFALGVRANIVLGGDNASRGVLLGALLAAAEGTASVPPAWRGATRQLGAAEALVQQLLDSRDAQGARG
ncbi:hypothetical protein HYH03_007832 [Edaphochlamys debaryana]|uniref:ADP-ribosylglycohydrolase n=1 Tax=Edaphochlamys debaryana TaxID=47281 RepID=A0A835Y7L5_9CHLO|nr:hypothetical protein HYH03_007832 [Edaphochlamys debaryana]|eukprot:KAG2493895.1 hypothetical protein HYH03_007832 [Edaphochlamys debaryana]